MSKPIFSAKCLRVGFNAIAAVAVEVVETHPFNYNGIGLLFHRFHRQRQYRYGATIRTTTSTYQEKSAF